MVCLQFELSRSVLAGFDALAPLTLEALLEGYEATQACISPISPDHCMKEADICSILDIT